MARSTNRRAIRWLREQLPALVSHGAITSANATAIERYYDDAESRTTNFGFVVLATVGAALVSAGIILIIAHNWDELSRPLRTAIAFFPLVASQALAFFVLMRRGESQPWREAAAIFNVAAIGTAMSLISQTYQIQGTFADFMRVWLLLSIPVVYLMRATFAAALYIIGTVVWQLARESWLMRNPSPNFFWLLLLLIVPYYLFCFLRERASRQTTFLSILLAGALAVGLGFTANFTKAGLGNVAFAGLFTAIYFCGMKFFPRTGERLHLVALLGGIGIGVTAVVLSFESAWRMGDGGLWVSRNLAGNLALLIEIIFPLAALALAVSDVLVRRVAQASFAAAAFPVVAAIAWMMATGCKSQDRQWTNTGCSFNAAVLMDVYALVLGVEILARGIRADSVARANFGLLVIAALALARFFDSDLSFVARGVGFIVIGVGFLVANVILFKKKRAAVA